MLSKILGLLGFGLPKLSAGMVAILGGLFIFAGAATWLREDGISDTNAKWELKVSQAAIAAHNAVAEKQLEVERLQKKLALKEVEDAEKARMDAEVLAKQQADFPLSPECMRCRVPNERIWVRGGKGDGAKSQSSISKTPGS